MGGRLGRLGSVLACLVLGGLADDVVAQSLDLKHSWVRTTGVAIQEDAAKGVAVWYDGTVMGIAERGESGTSATRRARVAFQAPGNPLPSEIEMSFVPTSGEVFPRGLAAASPPVERFLQQDPTFEPTAYTTGWFNGAATFGAFGLTADSTSNAWTAKVRRESGALAVKWATRFSGPHGTVQGLALAAGPRCGTTSSSNSSQRGGEGGNNSLLTQPFPPEPDCLIGNDFVAIGGVFSGTATFSTSGPVTRSSLNGTEDGYVALLGAEFGTLLTVNQFSEHGLITVCSTGADRVTGVAVDARDQSVILGGTFSDDELIFKFAGQTYPYTVTGYAGGADGFVAKCVWNAQQRLVPQWVYTFGASGDDGVGGVALDARGNVYATGWTKTTTGTRDLWVCSLPYHAGGSPFNTPGWEFVYSGTGDDAGLAVAVDGLDRPVFTGQFGLAGTPNQYTLDFNPSTTQTDNRMTAGGADVFLLRFVPWGDYDGALVFGGNKDDGGTAIGFDPADTTRLAHAGSFGSPDATGTYVVDFDPGSGGNANTATTGKGDAFVNSLTPLLPETQRRVQISLVLDNSASVTTLNYENLIRALTAAIGLADTMPTDTSVAINAIMYPFPGRQADAGSAMPWTVIDAETAELFRLRLFNLMRPILGGGGGGDNFMDEAVNLAVSRLQTSGLDAFYRHMFIIADEVNSEPNAPTSFPVIQAAKNAAISSSLFDQVNCLAVDESNFIPFNRDHVAGWVVESLVGLAAPAVTPESPFTVECQSLGYAAQTPINGAGYSDAAFAPLVNRMLRRMTRCPADYDHDGSLLAGDFTLFQTQSGLGILYADWNFDGVLDGHLSGNDRKDRRKFEREFFVIMCGP